jgi:hypothetical protein
MPSHQQKDAYKDKKVYFGDIHNHCGLSYAHGTFKEALINAQLQLDFTSVTLHAVWPDMPVEDDRLDYLIKFHNEGFSKAFENWSWYCEQVERHNQEGKFVIFPSYEWHSNTYGDHCIYYKNSHNTSILTADDLTKLRQEILKSSQPGMLIPHHLGYKQGYRGINWETFTNELSPVVEIFSFHGSSESSEGPYPYLHTMGPRNGKNCAQYGWSQGNVFGVVGSTDHHNAFPGSYGYGRLGVWSEALTREALWSAIHKRHTYALTGDRINLKFSLNGAMMGDICAANPERDIEVSVSGGDSIDYIEILRNNQVIHKECPLLHNKDAEKYKIYLELGWGEIPQDTAWNVDFQVNNGRIKSVEPRFRGFGSQGNPFANKYAYTTWQKESANHIKFSTLTRPNLSLHTPATEGMSVEIEGGLSAQITATINGKMYQYLLADLQDGTRTHYLGGFVSPAICFHRAVPETEYQHHFKFSHQIQSSQRDWYYIRARQKNNQWAWSSPIWIDPLDV